MILSKENVFHLSTNDTSYILFVDKSNHVGLQYYGTILPILNDYEPIKEKLKYSYGTSVISENEENAQISLDYTTLEYSTPGRGDYNEPSIILKNNDGYIFDFVYDSYSLEKEEIKLKELPSPKGIFEHLTIKLIDKNTKISAELHYFLDEESNIILRNTKIINNSDEEIHVLKLMSMQLELQNKDFEILNLYGGWACENNKNFTKIGHGIFINDSKTGYSSHKHNPFFMIKEENADYNNGDVYAFNLIYSGNHYEMVELNTFDKVRIQNGINPYLFDKIIAPGESFESPISVLTYSNKGMNGCSQNMHKFINNHIVQDSYKFVEKPILINNWEATMMNFTENKVLSIVKEAKKYGIENFALDDGWFVGRNNDNGGLGDYEVDKKKLPHGLDHLAKKVKKNNMNFGLWVEPEMINENSNLYREHPDWIISNPKIAPNKGRNQFVLDLTRKEVRDYIIENIEKTLGSAEISYIKWDCNRHISDVFDKNGKHGEFLYNYMVGLYEILDKITANHPDLLIEMCASGGNRFDLGMLRYCSQIWTSDDTDAFERISIQSGIALGYPLSTISNHVSGYTSQQLLRKIPLETRFNVACFGVLGYEFDVNELSSVEKEMFKSEIDFYKEHRFLFQYGNFYQIQTFEKSKKTIWQVMNDDKSEAVIGMFNSLQEIKDGYDVLLGKDFIDDATYEITVRKQKHYVKEFGNLINQKLGKIHVSETGKLVDFANRHFALDAETEHYVVKGKLINSGAIKLKQEWKGTGFDDDVRLLGDFGSRLYYIKKID